MRVYANLHDQKVSDVKAEITFGQVFPGGFKAIIADGEIRKTTYAFTKKSAQEGIIFIGERGTDMVTWYGKTRTETRNIVAI